MTKNEKVFAVAVALWVVALFVVGVLRAQAPPPVTLTGMTVGELRAALAPLDAERYVVFPVTGDLVKSVESVAQDCYEPLTAVYWITPRGACELEQVVVLN